VPLAPTAGEWTPVPVAYYPLWRASVLARELATRRGEYGDLEVRVDAGTRAIELTYSPAAPELAGLALGAAGLTAWLLAFRRRATSKDRE
jgi:hypothetical protein